MRGITPKTFGELDRSVLAFLSRTGQLAPVRSVSESTMLHDVIKIMAEERLHRLYIASDAEGAIRGVVTLSDIIRLLARHHSHKK